MRRDMRREVLTQLVNLGVLPCGLYRGAPGVYFLMSGVLYQPPGVESI